MSRRAVALRSYAFRHEREAGWRELEALVERVEKRGVRSLTAEELGRLPILYRATVSSLSVARAISLDRNVLEYLENLSVRAYLCVYGTRSHLRDAVGAFASNGFPRLVRDARWHMLVCAALLVASVVAGLVLTTRNMDRFYTLVPEALAGSRGPTSSTAQLEAVLYLEGDAGSMLQTFAAFLFTHNAKIGILSFALGFLLGVPVLFLMVTNGLSLGAMAAIYHDRALGLDFWAWVLPHGVTELLAVVLCGGAGLMVAEGLALPGRHTRLANLALRGRAAGQIVVGAIAMFFIAALIEGFFRQLVQSVPARAAVAFGSALAWCAYFTLAGRRRDEP